ncbi:MAG TPA: HAD family hydrolase [Ignavibacteria bacterium]|nr:HAD family hydrolase [Ignavibacteria bacterium]
MRKIKAVIFDLDGTLYNQTLLRFLIIISFLLNIVLKPRKTFAAMKVLEAFRKAHEKLRKLKDVNFAIADEQIKMTVDKSGMPEDKVIEIIDDWFYTFPLKFLKLCKKRYIEESINELKANGYRIGLLSDYYTERKLDKMELNGYFEIQMCSISKEVNSLKPNPDGFLKIAEALGVKPNECIYVGDRPHIDGVGAEAAGMIPIMISFGKVAKYRNINSFNDLFKLIKEIEGS